MPTYEYEIEETGEIIEIVQKISEDPLKKILSPKLKKECKCKRLISNNQAGGFVLKGDGWTVKSSGYGKRGYKGKYQHLVRDTGTPVDAPSNKTESDQQFQKWVDSGGLEGIKPTMNFDDKAKPTTGNERIERANEKKS